MNICVVGSGYVGLVSAACFAEMGNMVTCVDVNEKVVADLTAGKLHIFEPGLEPLVRRGLADGRLVFTTSLSQGLERASVVFICVGTPSRPDGSCDLGYVRQVALDIGRTLERDVVVVDKSTVPVGTADAVGALIRGELEKRGVRHTVAVVSNPEFLKEGDAVNDFMKPDRVIVGTDDCRAAELLELLYAPFARTRDKLIRMSARSAEMTKYAANCMLAAKISFINEIAAICEKVGADVRDVRTGIGADQRIGYHFIYPGLGYGGSCFPKDVKALIRTARDSGVTPGLLEAVDAVNDRQKLSMAHKIAAYFDTRGGVAGKTLAVWGLAFKANTDDLREAAALTIIEELTGRGMRVRAFDPVAGNNARAVFAHNDLVSVMDGQYDVLVGADALLVATEWNQFRTPDFERVKALLRLPAVFDGRNLYLPEAMTDRGFDYVSVGRAPALDGADVVVQENPLPAQGTA